MPTIVGTIFLCFAVFFFLFRQDRLFGLLIIASIFQGSAALKFGTRGLQSFFIIEMLIVLRSIGNLLLRPRQREPLPEGFWLLLFGGISIASAFIGPFLFAGMPIYDPLQGIDLGALIRPPLHFGGTNVTQVAYLSLHLATAYALMTIPYSEKKTSKAYLIAFYLLALCVFVQAFCRVTGIPFPDSVVRNSPDLMDLMSSPGLLRKPGPFMEPSFAGACLALYSIGFLTEYLEGKGKAFRVMVAIAASVAVTSTGSLFTLAIFAAILLSRYFPIRFPWYVNIKKGKRVLALASLCLVPIVLALPLLLNYQQVLLQLTVSKGESGSFINRTTSDIYALGILVHTYGIGVGLGSNRPSSLVTFLLSNVGIAGFLAFAIYYLRLFSGLSQTKRWLFWAGAALLFNMCVDVPDVTFPILWMAIFLAAQTRRMERKQLLGVKPMASDGRVLSPSA
ncbi:hypothetical protein JAO29_16230 [Edaphobacter sp. HDX4]|uniref:hypothetical protein n=1 Tax=Edaphobacter sp. HDX4 TaxID=2794064 RepID=UPI002FE572AF